MTLTKRSNENNTSKIGKKINYLSPSSYPNYKLSRSEPNEIERINLSDPKITVEYFYENFIKPRKPVLISTENCNSDNFRINIDDFKPENILSTLSNEKFNKEKLQVEELVDGGFGSGMQRLKMTLKEFLDRIENKKESSCLYLTTQYDDAEPGRDQEDEEDNEEDEDEDEEEGEGAESGLHSNFEPENISDSESLIFDPTDLHDDFEDDYEIDELLSPPPSELLNIYQPPLTNLLPDKISKLPTHATIITEPLIPQQINLWFGRTPDKSKSLEVKYDSNGEIVKVNRALSIENATSTGLHHDHADNLYVLVKGKKRFTLFSPDYANDLYTTGDVRCVYETGVVDYVRNKNAIGWKGVRADGGCLDTSGENEEKEEIERKCNENNDVDDFGEGKQDPPSFCKIPPVLLHLDEVDNDRLKCELIKFTHKKYPKFDRIRNSSMQVTLESGYLLYLPAGWFHEVTSYGSDDGIHVALNYWFVPPDGISLKEMYSDKTWKKDYEYFLEELSNTT